MSVQFKKQTRGARCARGLRTILLNTYLFNMIRTRSANENSVPIFTFHKTVVGQPTKSCFRHRKSMLFGDGTN